MRITDTCGHCDGGLISMSCCPSCWGTTVSPKALAQAEAEVERLEARYEAKRKANKILRGRARGMAGHELSQLGDILRALKAEVDHIKAEARTNKAVARAVGAAAAS